LIRESGKEEVQKIKYSTKLIQEVKMTEETEASFEMDEEKALRQGFEEARDKGKLFNLNTWKKKREEQRARLNISASSDEDV
jgi:hypothetical protein